MLLSINSVNPQMRLVRQAAKILDEGGVIIYPTDTVYGLGCDLYNKRGIERIYEIKKLSKKEFLSFICADLKDISEYALVTDFAYKIMRRLLPGPYTFILRASRLVPKIILPKKQTTGIRIPNHPTCLSLVRELGRPIISTSVKDDTGELMNDPILIHERFRGRVDLVIDGGIIPAQPSTIVSLVDDRVEIVRVGKGDVKVFQ
ncbi:MAG: L-threonylcarbamoyladenylate synthase [Syntrophales bacterium]|nr:L-threonylcarbamoyladenylate synthase [Syntrophales bacterium]